MNNEFEKVDLTRDDENILKEIGNMCASIHRNYNGARVFTALVNYTIACAFKHLDSPEEARDYLIHVTNERYKEWKNICNG